MHKRVKVHIKPKCNTNDICNKLENNTTQLKPEVVLCDNSNIMINGVEFYSLSNVEKIVDENIESYRHTLDILKEKYPGIIDGTTQYIQKSTIDDINKRYPGLIDGTTQYVPVEQVTSMCNNCSYRGSKQTTPNKSNNHTKSSNNASSDYVTISELGRLLQYMLK